MRRRPPSSPLFPHTPLSRAPPPIFEAELGAATRQVVSDVRLTVRTVRDARLVSAMRAYPNLADLDPAREPLALGNVEAGDHTIFILELDLPARPPVRARVAQDRKSVV